MIYPESALPTVSEARSLDSIGFVRVAVLIPAVYIADVLYERRLTSMAEQVLLGRTCSSGRATSLLASWGEKSVRISGPFIPRTAI